MRQMMAWAIVVLLCTAPVVMAQQIRTVRADVPFAFVVRDMKCPAGEYGFLRNRADASRTIFMTNESTGERILFVAGFVDFNYNPNPQTKLVFYRYGDRYFLREIHEGAGAKVALMAGEEERQLQVAGVKRERAVVLAWLR
ncbi:MAG: hypothetical protein KatS3mg005_3567 [Bryobacteraceae bacterium]|nr:MAG: hypothetical protein KatS3mg005_3567 [Bryobacteraceae bacterium]